MSEMPPPLPSESDEETVESSASPDEERLEFTPGAEEEAADPAADPYETLFEEDEAPVESSPPLSSEEDATAAGEPMTASYTSEAPAQGEKQTDTQLIILIAVIVLLLLLCCCCDTLAFFWYCGDQILGLT